MATNTRRAARQRDDGQAEADSQSRTEGVGARSRAASETAASHTNNPTSPPRGAEHEDEGPSEHEFADEEDELEHYAELAQDQLESRIQKMRKLVKRKRDERELMQLRRELQGEPVASLRGADETATPAGRPSKRRRSSASDESRRPKRHVRPAEPLYYQGRNIKELEEFLVFWAIQWESEPDESETSRVKVAARYLRGTPMKLWGQRVQSNADPISKWDDFKQWLRDSLKAPNQRILESTLALKDMRQRTGQTCKDLYIYMTELENNIPTMSEDQRRAWMLINALRPELRSRVVRDLQTIDSVEEVIACAGRNESTSIDRPANRLAQRYTRDSPANETEAKDSDTLPIRSKSKRGQNFGYRGRGFRFRSGDSHSNRERSAFNPSKTTCRECGKEDHQSVDCPNKRSKND
jgi:hypothetical protein